MGTIGHDLAEQNDRAWSMLEATIGRFTDDQWRTGPAPGLTPVRWASHAVETADWYLRPLQEESDWDRRFGGADWEGDPAALPSQKDLLAYLHDVQTRTRAFLAEQSDADYLADRNAHPWTGRSLLQRVLYTLRHTMTHQGELSAALRAYGAQETEWR